MHSFISTAVTWRKVSASVPQECATNTSRPIDLHKAGLAGDITLIKCRHNYELSTNSTELYSQLTHRDTGWIVCVAKMQNLQMNQHTEPEQKGASLANDSLYCKFL